MTSLRSFLIAATIGGAAWSAQADGPPARKAPADLPEIKKLPDPFTFQDGSKVKDRADWPRRRAELQGLFQDYEYGHLPPKPEFMTILRGEPKSDETAKVVRQDLDVTLNHAGKSLTFHVALTLPAGADGPVPAVIQSTFGPPRGATPAKAQGKAQPAPRPDRLAVFTDRGYAVAEPSFVEFAPDRKDHDRTAGVYALFGPDIDCGALMAWAWGVSRTIDALERDDRIDAKKIVVTGHSRYGKAALLAGAFDDRVALTVPSHSGSGGASPYRFIFGKAEQLHNAATAFPHWFRPGFAEFIGHVDRLPIDQHELRALVAPRPLLATEGTQDTWISPQGSQLTHQAARKVYDFLGAPDRISIRFRPTGHIPSNEDLVDFADHLFRNKPLPPEFSQLAYPEETNAFDWDVPQPR
ncbi:alpha/beta hydrolase family protein [Tundrisphaera sp. TA3]|uniref:alpha/beta hydrolase family protein n=1 Tax=Tundrisphaera sp. TA3 TaxID=3435775 RepID=UPI003EB7A0C7